MNNIILSDIINAILSKGVSLESIGSKNRALSKQEALNALNQFKELQVPVLGGDVCELFGGVVIYNYDNWFCDRSPNESDLNFVNRSVEKAREYIENYRIKELNKIFFAFVLDVESVLS